MRSHNDTSAEARTLLVSMPIAALERPCLGLALLQAAAHRAGQHCETQYLGFELAEQIGLDAYQWVAHTLPYEAFIGEWLFTEALYGAEVTATAAFENDVLHGTWHFDEHVCQQLQSLRSTCTSFIMEKARSPDWGQFDIIGFTSTFHQNLASLALAKQIKHLHPEVTIVFGGANWEGEMGAALLDEFKFVDAACSGEADASFPLLVRRVAAGLPVQAIPGVQVGSHVAAAHGEAAVPVDSASIQNLDDVPIPDFEPFFKAVANSTWALDLQTILLLETARGCWWGDHSHCTFCGLNGATMSFRSKSPERVMAEIKELSQRWGSTNYSVVDNILDMRYFRTVLPELINDDEEYQFFWEIKANLSRKQVKLLADAGVHTVQPGIESLSDEVLECMGKGATAVQNVALMKWCAEYGVTPEWNVLYGFPDENPDDYVEMARLAASIHHLQPPSGLGKIRMDRFSPYHEDPDKWDMRNIRPAQPFGYLYPRVSPRQLMRIAYYFDFDYGDDRDPHSYAAPMVAAVDSWRKHHSPGALRLLTDDDARIIVDTRGPTQRTARLEGWKAALYDALDRGHTRDEIDQLDQLGEVSAADVDAFLDRAVATGALLLHGARYLALAVHTPARTGPVARPIRRLPLVPA